MVAALEKVYAAPTTLRRATLYHSIASFRILDTDTMQKHCNTFTRLLQELSSARGDVTLEIFSSLLLLSVALTWVDGLRTLSSPPLKNWTSTRFEML
jgi:gag-polypeptide of LTR copia-type